MAMLPKDKLVALGVENKEVKQSDKKQDKSDEIRLDFIKKPLTWQLISILFLVMFVVSIFFMSNGGITGATVKDVGAGKARDRVQNYVDTVLQGRFPATLGEAREEEGLYEIDITIQGQKIESYVTKDGRLFFPNVVDLDLFEAAGGIPTVIASDNNSDEESNIEIKPSIENTEDNTNEESIEE